MLARVVTGVNDPALNFWLTLLEVKPVSDFHLLPEIRVSYVDLVHVGPLEETKIYHRWGSVNQARRS